MQSLTKLHCNKEKCVPHTNTIPWFNLSEFLGTFGILSLKCKDYWLISIVFLIFEFTPLYTELRFSSELQTSNQQCTWHFLLDILQSSQTHLIRPKLTSFPSLKKLSKNCPSPVSTTTTAYQLHSNHPRACLGYLPNALPISPPSLCLYCSHLVYSSLGFHFLLMGPLL